MEQIEVSTRGRQAFHDITAEVQAVVNRSGVQDGLCFVFCPHTTAGLTLNEIWDSSVRDDIGRVLDRLVPQRGDYLHVEGNAPAHIKTSIVGASCCLPIAKGKLVLGTWQGIFLAEFDGPRHRRVLVTVTAG